jgi:hypothetical protein
MSKAEERALERFPVHEGASKEWTEMHLKSVCAEYIEGYHQAEKDSELTWEDMRELYIIFAEVDTEIELNMTNITAETLGYYQEVLKRFKDFKERKKK